MIKSENRHEQMTAYQLSRLISQLMIWQSRQEIGSVSHEAFDVAITKRQKRWFYRYEGD